MIPECHNKKQPWETRPGLGLAGLGGWIYLFAFKDLIKLLEGKIEDLKILIGICNVPSWG